MKKIPIEKLRWRKLDNSAKLFPILSTKRFSTVFRMSVILKEEIQPVILQQATKRALKDFDFFKVRLRKGFFWYYLEYNPEEPIIEKEHTYPCKYIDKKENRGYLFKVTYYQKKINLDVFHSLTDGNTAIEFLKAIMYQYIELAHTDKFTCNPEENSSQIEDVSLEDSYIKNYQKHLSRSSDGKKAYVLKGKKLPLYGIGVVHGQIELKPILKECRKKKVTLTQYFTAVLIQSIYEENYKKHPSKKPIKICLPVNLKKFFDSKTVNNFFGYITVATENSKVSYENFDEILEFVKEEFQKKLTKEELTKTMSANVGLGNNFLIRIIPLFMKKVALQISYMEIRKYTTTTLSNLGKINVLPEYQSYIDTFLVLIAPEQVEKIKSCVISYEEQIIFSFTSTLENQDIEKNFFEKLKQTGAKVDITTNGVYKKEEKEWYPKISNIKKSHLTIKILLTLSILLSLLCVVINYTTSQKFHWSFLCMVGIIYCWATTLYSIRKNINIAQHVMFQTIGVSILGVAIDWIIGYQGWSINLMLPITVIVANVAMLTLYIVTYKKYVKYIIYQVIIFIFSMIPVVLYLTHTATNRLFVIISTVIAFATVMITLLFSGREFIEELKRRFHI